MRPPTRRRHRRTSCTPQRSSFARTDSRPNDGGRAVRDGARADSAHARYRELAAQDTSDISARGLVGASAAVLRDTATAQRISDQLAHAAFPYARGRDTYWRAAIAAQLGQQERAVNLLTQALGEGATIGVGLHRAVEFQPLHGYEPFEAILRPKD